MKELKLSAPAKINLTLDVLGKRPDGFHDLCMVMQTVSLEDEVTLRLHDEETGGANTIRMETNLPYLPSDGNNLAVKAARAFEEAMGETLPPMEIRIRKSIPVCAGTAGGSSDAAAVLRGLNRLYENRFSAEELARIGEQVGSDVPYCVLGGTKLAEGKGERLTDLTPLPDCTLVLCKPGFAISTPELFHAVDSVRLCCHPNTAGVVAALQAGDLREISMRMYNVFEDVLPPGRRGIIQEIKDTLLDGGALGACMSGTGPTVFGLFTDEHLAEQTVKQLKKTYRDTYLAKPVSNCI